MPDSSCVNLMERIKELMTKPGVCLVKKTTPENDVDCEVNTYRYENPNDSQYCSQHSVSLLKSSSLFKKFIVHDADSYRVQMYIFYVISL